MTGPVVVAREVWKSYGSGGRAVPVLKGIDLTIDRGSFTAIRGPSGCGKTTLLNCLSGLDDVDKGNVTVEGANLAQMRDGARTKHRGERMGFVFQSFNLIPVLSALQNVELPLLFLGMKRQESRRRATEALKEVGLQDRARHKPRELSGGQQQRVAIARALANRPAIVWADEPTGNLDSESGLQVLNLLLALRKEKGITFVIVTHSDTVSKAADRVIWMDSGRIAPTKGTG